MTDLKMRFFSTLHPAVILCYFIGMLGLTLACVHPVTVFLSLMGASWFLLLLRGAKALGKTMRFVGPMFLFVALANPLFNHRGVTMLFLLFDQWITLEAISYGLVSAGLLAAVIVWFACYQEVMTSDKFLYLFGQIAPSASLLITMTLRFIPQLQRNAGEIKEARRMLSGEPGRLTQKLKAATRELSALLGMSMEQAVETADSMKARGYGMKRRTTFHLFRFDSRDAGMLAAVLALAGVCTLARIFGHGYMEFYPRMTAVLLGASSYTQFVLFGLLAALPGILEGREAIRWRCFGLMN